MLRLFISFSLFVVSLFPHPLISEAPNSFASIPSTVETVPTSIPAVTPAIEVPVVVPPPAPKVTKEVVLDVPLHYQIYTLSCEAASLQMALAQKGITENQNDLLAQIGIAEPYQSSMQNGVMIWGDPNLGFVGNVKGFFSTKGGAGLMSATGWGVNNAPIAKVAATFRPESQAYSNFTSEQIIRELDLGNPIIFWHVPDSYTPGTITYQTPAGNTISFSRNHVAVISGYEIIDGATRFFISDPLYGEYSLQKSTLERRMAKYNGDVVVVR